VADKKTGKKAETKPVKGQTAKRPMWYIKDYEIVMAKTDRELVRLVRDLMQTNPCWQPCRSGLARTSEGFFQTMLLMSDKTP